MQLMGCKPKYMDAVPLEAFKHGSNISGPFYALPFQNLTFGQSSDHLGQSIPVLRFRPGDALRLDD